MTAAVGAADVMVKAAHVRVGSVTCIGDGLVTVPLHGDIAAVREALEAGAVSPAAVGHVVASHAIGRPAGGLIDIFALSRALPAPDTEGGPSD